MIEFMQTPASTLLLAQRSNADGAAPVTTAPGGTASEGADGGGAPAKAPPGGGLFALMPVFLVLMILMMVFSGRKQKKKRAELMSSLSKQDKVQTVGGVIGTIVELREHDVLLKVDEGSGTRVRFARSAIQSVLKPAHQRDIESSPAEVKPEQFQRTGV